MTHPSHPAAAVSRVSPRSRLVAFALGGILGVFGAHRFYVGKVGSGLAMLVTIGGLGLWYVYDLIMIATGNFTDQEGRRLLRWDPEEPLTTESQLPADVLDELRALRAEVADLHERVEFTERLLSKGRE